MGKDINGFDVSNNAAQGTGAPAEASYLPLQFRKAQPKGRRADGKYITKQEYAAFGVGAIGQNLINSFVTTYILYFATDVLKLGAALPIIFLLTKIFDGVNDLFMGGIVDKTKTRWGKLRPYIRFTAIPMAIVSMLLFMPYGLTGTPAIVLFTALLVLQDIVYTLSDVPFWGLTAAVTPNETERGNFITFARIACSFGGAATIVIMIVFEQIFPGTENDAMRFMVAAIFFCVIGGPLFTLASRAKERVVNVSEQKDSFFDKIKYVLKNKPLMLLLISQILLFARSIATTIQVHFSKVFFGGQMISIFGLELALTESMVITVLNVSTAVAGLLAMLIMPKCRKRFSDKSMYIAAIVLGSICMAAMFAMFEMMGKVSIWIILIFNFGFGFVGGVFAVIPTVMLGECVDYCEWETGQRTEGATFSLLTLMSKISGALAMAVSSLLLIIFKYSAGAGADQSAFTITGIKLSYTVIPAVLSLLAILPMLKYKFTGKTREKIFLELKERREKEGYNVQVLDD